MNEEVKGIQFWHSGDWTMVYLDGQLVVSGDHYHADEWLQEHCGVTVVQDDDGICIPDGHNAIKTLDKVMASLRAREDREKRAAALRQQAQNLLDEATGLEAER